MEGQVDCIILLWVHIQTVASCRHMDLDMNEAGETLARSCLKDPREHSPGSLVG